MLEDLVGQVLDEKYRIKKRLGQGGMGAVYLAIHLGTGRPVALKIIAPQLMAYAEFVERFRREAKAAGLLRHPNIVDVTDFGFAQSSIGQIAYLVMEYLEGCSLGEVLKEERRLPINWVIDILEQVCLAVDKAHQQGIIHRDLKPDNIWLEPNERGGYTVKVLDFGLAKLAGSASSKVDSSLDAPATISSINSLANETAKSMATAVQTPATPAPTKPSLEFTEGATQVQTKQEIAVKKIGADSGAEFTEGATQAQPPGAPPTKRVEHPLSTKNITDNIASGALDTELSANLTRADAILGTPIYMSPEQCLGEEITLRSDIYSLGIIAYEMLTGALPFTGTMGQLINAHIGAAPPPIKSRRADIPAPLAELVMSALEKEPARRPQSAAAFANAMHARSQSAGAILRRAFSLYGDHFPTFFRISLIAHIPLLIVQLLLLLNRLLAKFSLLSLGFSGQIGNCLDLGDFFATIFASIVNYGAFVPVVAQLLIAPMREIEIKQPFFLLKKRLKAFLLTALLYQLKIFPIVFLFAVPSLIHFSLLSFVSAAFGVHSNIELNSDSGELALKWRLLIVTGLLLLASPGIRAYINNLLYASVVMMEGLSGNAALKRARDLSRRSLPTFLKIILFYVAITVIIYSLSHFLTDQLFGNNINLSEIANASKDPSGISISSDTTLAQVISMIFVIILNPLISVTFALLYFKTRQINGETLPQILGNYEQGAATMRNWQKLISERVHNFISSSDRSEMK